MNLPLLSVVSVLLIAAHPASALEEPKPAGRPPGPPPGMEMQGPQLTAGQEIQEYLTLDRNGDGNLSKDEIPERFQGLVTRADTDKDGIVSSEELVRMTSLRFAAKAKRGEERGGPPPGGMLPRDANSPKPEPHLNTP